jgi:bifunctional UDP-N-acetylglucosamine pyrophosphorylase/glucosamine-1-phosphate N-acetyltransferase/UDP-N-acetylglucosamine pyrophosphorylase
MAQAVGVILAAGKGTRMKSELPKVLCEAAGRPLVKYVIDSLRAAGVGRLLAVVGYREDLVRETLASEADLGFASQTEQLGTGHAVMMCREALAGHSGPVVIVAGDSPMLQASSIRALLDDFSANQPACLLGTLKHPSPHGLGRIVRDASGKFVRIVEEKDATDQERAINEVNMSTYVFDCQKMLAALGQLTANNKQREYYITDLPEILLRQGEDVRALACLQPIEALSVNTVDQLAEVEAALAAQGRS